jgi:integrase/recombinase XerC
MLMDTAIPGFLLHLVAEKGYSRHTAQSYRSDLRLFCAFLTERSAAREVEEVTTESVRSWVVEMKTAGLANATIARRLHALRSFWRYLQDVDLTTRDPLRKVATPKKQQSLPRYLKVDELRQLLDAAQRHTVVALAFRNYAMIALLAYTGIRKSELLALKLDDVDLDGARMVVRGKGSKWRALPLPDEARTAVADWLELRDAGCGHDYLFTTSRGNRIHPSRMQRIWRSILERSGVRRGGVTMHTLRHSMATLLLQSGACDVVQLQQLLGHSRLDTTAVYLHVEPGSLRKAIEGHPLRGNVEPRSAGWRGRE